MAAKVEKVVIQTDSAKLALAKYAITFDAVPPGQQETRIKPTAKKVGSSKIIANHHPSKGITVN